MRSSSSKISVTVAAPASTEMMTNGPVTEAGHEVVVPATAGVPDEVDGADERAGD